MNICIYTNIYVSLVAQTVKNLPPMQQTWVLSLSQEDPLEKEVATHCSIFAGVSPWTEKPSRLSSMGSQRVRDNWTTNTHTYTYIQGHMSWRRHLMRCIGPNYWLKHLLNLASSEFLSRSFVITSFQIHSLVLGRGFPGYQGKDFILTSSKCLMTFPSLFAYLHLQFRKLVRCMLLFILILKPE